MNVLDTVFEQHKTWLENAKHDLWVQEYNLKVAQQRLKETETSICLYQSKIEGLRYMIGNFQAMINFLNSRATAL